MADGALTEFLVLSRGKWDESLAPETIQAAIDRFYAWHEAHCAAGRAQRGSRLDIATKLVTKRGIIDGPFAETKEIVGGYWFVYAPSLEAAAQMMSENPCVACGLQLEIRPTTECRGDAFVTSCETPTKKG